jgi:hypothetical protein
LDNTKDSNGNYVEADGIIGPKTKQAYINYLNSLKKSPTYTQRSFNEIKTIESQINSKDNTTIINTYHQAK